MLAGIEEAMRSARRVLRERRDMRAMLSCVGLRSLV